jgi:LmbE family N-acetylglucosaminyl deacetylase
MDERRPNQEEHPAQRDPAETEQPTVELVELSAETSTVAIMAPVAADPVTVAPDSSPVDAPKIILADAAPAVPGSAEPGPISGLLDAIPELQQHLAAARTFGFAAPVTVTAEAGATWISTVNELPLEFPHTWIKGPREGRFFASRQRVRKLLDRVCGLAPDQPPPKTVVIVAHPDDEAIGAGARLRDLPDVTIIYVTDGAPRDPEYALRKGYATREAYAKSRQEELLGALAVVGISPEATRCLDVVDGEAADRLVEVTYRLAELLDELRPDVVLTHPYEGGHTDHDATAFAVHLACGILRRDAVPAPIVLELTSYHFFEGRRRTGEFLPYYGLEERTIELEASTQALKQEMYDQFASQAECLTGFGVEREKFRAAPRYVFTAPPHGGPLLYELCRALDSSTWRERAARALTRLRTRKQRLVTGS